MGEVVKDVAQLINQIRSSRSHFTDKQLIEEIFVDGDETYLESNNNYIWYYSIGLVFQPLKILEFGTRNGYSLLTMIKGAEYRGKQTKDIELWSYDAEIDLPGSQQRCKNFFTERGHKCVFNIIKTEDIEGLSIEGVDLVHIDANHTPDGVYHECWLGFNSLKVGGHLLVDDYKYNVVFEGANRFRDEYALKSISFDSQNGLLLCQK